MATPTDLQNKGSEDGNSSSPHLESYEIVGRLGQGGMGVVYKARHKLLGHHVAIKITRGEYSANRFLQEARLLATVRSPHVVTIHDFNLDPENNPILIMEWVEGRSLAQRIEAGEMLAEQEVTTWMKHTCQGMNAAASKGIVHRDLKPSNILIDLDGCAKVADFGVACEPNQFTNLTQSGMVLGTPLYMAPEQAEDPRSVDTRADIYSFGATFYHAITGKPPFTGPTSFAVFFKHKTEPLVSPLSLRPELSSRISEIVERCLAKSPPDRFASFAEILKHLEPPATANSPWVDSSDPELVAYIQRFQKKKAGYLAEDEPSFKELEVFSFPRGQILRIVRGNIVDQQVDAVVGSDGTVLDMEVGVSRAIREAAGEEVAREASRLGPVRPGRAAITSGGNLKARFILHGVTVGFSDGIIVVPSRDLICEIMSSCFYHADSHGLKSIAFPLFGTGVQQFPRDVCLETMFIFLARMFLRGITSVTEARIVIFPE